MYHDRLLFFPQGIPAFYSLMQAGWNDPERTDRLMQHVAGEFLFTFHFIG